VNVRDACYEVLRTHGITTIFGNPGSDELPLLRDFPRDFRYIRALHEGAAIGMADGYAQATGQPALVNLHAAAGPGNALGHLANTQSGHVPVIVTSGQQGRRPPEPDARPASAGEPGLAGPRVKWSREPARPQDVPQALSTGIFLATAAPAGPVSLSLPPGDWDQDADLSALGQLRSRSVGGRPIVPAQDLARLRDRLTDARNPVLVVGPGTDNQAGWDGAVRLSEKLALPVLVAPSPSRCPFPTRHPNFRGLLPAGIPALARHFDGHDLVVAFGAAVFRQHEFAAGDYLPAGCELWAVTADPEEAARAPFGHILVGDPSDALTRLAGALPPASRPPLPPRAPLPEADTTGPPFTGEAILDALNAAITRSTVIAHEWSPAETKWDRFELSRPGSLYFPAAGLGWGLPAAIGLQLGDPARRVLCLLGDGTLPGTVSGLWTAAQYNIPVVFVVACNSGTDSTALAASYGIAAQRAGSLAELTSVVREALAARQPRLIEISQRRSDEVS
jgi:benzoylformate decarboxylase